MSSNNEPLELKLKLFFAQYSDDYSFVISTDKLCNISMTVVKMIVNMYCKLNGKFIEFKQKMSIMRQPGVSNVKYDTFIELLFKSLNDEDNTVTSNTIGFKNKKRNFLKLIKTDAASGLVSNGLPYSEQNIQRIKSKLNEISAQLKGAQLNPDLLQLQPILQKDNVFSVKEDISGRNYISGVEICHDPEMDLLKIAIHNSSMVKFYKQKLNMDSSVSTTTAATSSGAFEKAQLKQEATELPIHKHKQEIIQLVNENHISIITSQTGSGKSTQLPQFFLQSKLSSKIIMTQPRRLAVTTLSSRIASEMHTVLGERVGYKIRFDSCVSDETQFTIATEGVLLTELTLLIKEKRSCEYTHIIIDEAHERSLNLDVILSLLKLGVRMKLMEGTKIVITSAGLNAREFTSFFYNVPVLNIGGSKNYPVVEIFAKRPCYDQFKETLKFVKQIHENEKINESVLIFMPGLEEIEVVSNLLSSHLTDIKIIKLHSMKENKDNIELFSDFKDTRKIIVSTNIAETSVTLPSVSFMINSGLYKLKTESKNIAKLSTIPITQMMNLQRVGRLGRVSKGTVYHLFTETDYDLMIQNNISEIEITNLKLVMLIKNYIASNLQLIKEPKKSHSIKAELDLIQEGALTSANVITEMGQFIIKMPLSYNHSRLLYICIQNQAKRLGIILVSFLSQRSPLIKSSQKKKKYENMFVGSSDHLSLVNLSLQYNLQPVNNREIWCKNHDLDFKIMSQANKIKKQLELLFEIKGQWKGGNGVEDTAKFSENSRGESERLIRAINISLSRNNVAKKINLSQYQILSNGLLVKIHPSSVFMGKIGDLPEYICFEEVLVLNDVNFVSNVSEFDPTVVLTEDVCRGDYRLVRKIGHDNDNKQVENLFQLAKEWVEMKSELVDFYKNQKEQGGNFGGTTISTKMDSGAESKKSFSSDSFSLKRRKKGKLNL